MGGLHGIKPYLIAVGVEKGSQVTDIRVGHESHNL